MSLDEDLKQLADELKDDAPEVAERVDSLRIAVQPGVNAGGWDAIDIFRAIDPSAAAAALRGRLGVDISLAKRERWRNILALVPVFMTWFGLVFAAKGYDAALTARPELGQRSFLLLWEEGFNDYGPWPSQYLTLSSIAIVDLAAIAALLWLTWRIHSRVNVSQVKRERRAFAIQTRLHHAVWRASLELAGRGTHAATFETVRQRAEELLDLLRAHQERLGQFATERAQQVAEMGQFVTGFKAGTADIAHLARALKGAYDEVGAIAKGMDTRTAELIRQQSALTNALESVQKEFAASAQSQKTAAETLTAVIGQVTTSTDLLAEAGARSLGGSASFVEAARVIQAELGALRKDLMAEREGFAAVVSWADQAGDTLQQALAGTEGALRGLERGTTAIADLVPTLTELPEKIANATKREADAAEAIGNAGRDMATTVGEIDHRWSDALAAIEQAAKGMEPIVPAMMRLIAASEQLERRAAAVVAAAPTSEILVDAWRSAMHEQANGVSNQRRAGRWERFRARSSD